MRFAVQLFICFIIPLAGGFLYYKLSAKVEDNTVFKIGLIATINYLLLILQILTIRFWEMSGMNILIWFYLAFVAPVLLIGFIFWIWQNRKFLIQHYYALFSSIVYLAVILVFIIGFFLSHQS